MGRMQLIHADSYTQSIANDCNIITLFLGNARLYSVYKCTNVDLHLGQAGQSTPDWKQGCQLIEAKNKIANTGVYKDPANDPTLNPEYVYCHVSSATIGLQDAVA